jgi:hypothetical protein
MLSLEKAEETTSKDASSEQVGQALFHEAFAVRWRPYPPYHDHNWPPRGGSPRPPVDNGGTWPPGGFDSGSSSDGPIVCPDGQKKQNHQCVPG